MKKFLIIFSVLLSFSAARAELLVSEGFEGPANFAYWNGTSWETLMNFVGPGFTQMFADPKLIIGKETSGCFSGNQCIRLYDETPGGTSEFWTKPFNPRRSELWITWWEKLSTDYDINEGHKWFLFQCEQNGDDPYINWQSWDGGTDKELNSRVYNSGPIACSNQTFAASKAITLPSNQWYQYKIHIKLNTIGQNDGHFQVWIKKDGVNWITLWNLRNISNLRCNTPRNIVALRFGGTRERGPVISSRGIKWIDEIMIGTAEADVDSGSNPSVPVGLRIIR